MKPTLVIDRKNFAQQLCTDVKQIEIFIWGRDAKNIVYIAPDRLPFQYIDGNIDAAVEKVIEWRHGGDDSKEIKVALEQWLEFGEQMHRDGHQGGYFSGSGWAAKILRKLLERIPC